MIDYLLKDITTVAEGTIVHGCNCSGGFGSGVAGAIRKAFPEVYEMFKEHGTGAHLLGSIHLFLGTTYPNLTIVNGYTQLKYGRDRAIYADVDAIEQVLMATAEYVDCGNKNLYMPKIGCGHGGLDWKKNVLPIVEKVNEKFPDISIHICDI